MRALTSIPCQQYRCNARARHFHKSSRLPSHRALALPASRCSAVNARGATRRQLHLVCLNIPGMLMSLGQPSKAKQAAALVQDGMRSFRRGDVVGSIQAFDEALRQDPAIRPYLWQRGLSLYYAEQYEAAAMQFRDDVAVNPSDTEEAIWAFLSEAKLLGASKARRQFLQVGRDPREVMQAAYSVFQDGSDPAKILQAADIGRSNRNAFYANLYIGLFFEAEGDQQRSGEAILRALDTEYARASGDYMAALALVHAQLRGLRLGRSWSA